MWFQIKWYIIFLWHAKNQHSVHSPFVFDLWTKCVYTKQKFSLLKQYRKALYTDHNRIKVTDLGAGSRVFKSNIRTVKRIAKTAGIPNKRQQLLARLSAYFKPSNMLELGTSLGLATTALALGNPEGSVTTVEGCPNTQKTAKAYFEQFGFKSINSKHVNFNTFFKENSNEFDLVYLDGGHDKATTLSCFNALLEIVNTNSIIILDDIYWSAQMREAWLHICQHPKVTVSIDTFHWGWVFFRTQQPKQHFVLRM